MIYLLRQQNEKDDKCTEKSADTVVPIFYDLEWPPNVPNQSLYKSDPKRRNPNARAFTRQPDIDKAMAQVLDTLQVRKTRATPLINLFVNKITASQCGNFIALLLLRFCVKSILRILKVQNLPF